MGCLSRYPLGQPRLAHRIPRGTEEQWGQVLHSHFFCFNGSNPAALFVNMCNVGQSPIKSSDAPATATDAKQAARPQDLKKPWDYTRKKPAGPYQQMLNQCRRQAVDGVRQATQPILIHMLLTTQWRQRRLTHHRRRPPSAAAVLDHQTA